MATTVPNNPFDVTQGGSGSGSNTGAASNSTSNGIIGGTIQKMDTPVQPQSYTAQQREVNRATETAGGQVESMLAKDSPLMQRARTLAMQNMNQRGLVNSSMSQGAGVAAMIDRITPIAQQDAATYSNRSLTNQAAVNEANQFNVGQGNSLYAQGQQQKFQTSEREAGQAFTAGQSELDRAQQTALQKSQQAFTAGENVLDRSQQTTLQKAQQDFTSAQATLDRAQQTALADKSIEAQKALQIAQQEFTSAQAALDRTQQTSLADKNIAAQQALQANQFSFQGQQAELERAQQMTLSQNQIQAQKDLQSTQQSFQSAQAELDRAQQAAMADKSIAAQQALQTAQYNFQSAQADMDRAQQVNLQISQQTFQAEQQVKQNQADLDKLGVQLNFQKAQVPATFAANISNTAMNGVNAIMADGNLNADQKRAAIDNIVNYANSQISWSEKFYGTTIPKITAPATPGSTSTTNTATTAPPPYNGDPTPGP